MSDAPELPQEAEPIVGDKDVHFRVDVRVSHPMPEDKANLLLLLHGTAYSWIISASMAEILKTILATEAKS